MRRQIENAIDAGDGDFRVRSLRQALASRPDDLGVRLELGQYYERSGYPDLAIEHYRLAAARFSESPVVQLRLAKTLRSSGMREEAAQGLESYIQAHRGESAELASWLGLVRDELGQLKQAESAHRAAVSLSPDSDFAHNNLGYNLLLQGRNDEAAVEFRQALRLKPDSQVARNNLGVALADHPGEAVLNWQSISDPASAHNNLAALWIEQGRYTEARTELEVALGYNKRHQAALKNLELVSRLDGQPAIIPVKPVRSGWARCKSILRIVVIGTDRDQDKDEALRTASK